MTQAMSTSRSRIREEVRRLVQIMPMVSATAMFMNVVDCGESDDDIAATDGKNLYLWPRFYQLNENERRGTLLHEYFHAVWKHPERMERMRRRDKGYVHEHANIAADYWVNEALALVQSRTIALPEGALKWSDFVELAKNAEIKYEPKLEMSACSYDIEQIYHIIRQAHEHITSCESMNSPGDKTQEIQNDNHQDGSSQPVASDGQPTNASAKEPSPAPANDKKEDKKRDAIDALRRLLKRPATIRIQGLSGATQQELENDIRIGRERILNDVNTYGANTAGIVERLKRNLPKVQTPWERHLRHATASVIDTTRHLNPRRPGRPMLSQMAIGQNNIVWTSGRKRAKRPHIVAILDSSGSIDESIYRRYLGECDAMRRRTNCQLTVIVADAEVCHVEEIRNSNQIAHIPFKGRGGTSFEPGIALAEQLGADAIVYLTDLIGSFPEKRPSANMIWVVVPGHAAREVPYGKIVEVN